MADDTDTARTSPDLATLREEYAAGGLAEQDLTAEPITLFRRWLDDVSAAGLHEPNAMVVATASTDGAPSARTVLLKGLDEGFVFFTNYDSAKSRDLEAVARCALLFPWHALQRQVRVEGTVQRIARSETEAYFASRPRASQLGAWASPQSEVVADRDELERRYRDAAERFADDEVPAPEHWGGYRVLPESVEFWQGRIGRMHDRLRYRRDADGWRVERLAP